MDPTQRPIDPEFIGLACQMTDCEPDNLLAVRWESEELYVVAAGHPSYLFTAQQIYEAGRKYVAVAIALGLHGRPPEGWYDQHIRPARPAPVDERPSIETDMEIEPRHRPEPAPAHKGDAKPKPTVVPGSRTGKRT